jgi:hypothetical protein
LIRLVEFQLSASTNLTNNIVPFARAAVAA